MAVLPDADRIKIWRGIMRYLSNLREGLALDKTQLRDAINATDDWIDANAASFNAALPLAARTNLTVSQKAFLLCIGAAMRVSEAFARKLLGEVD